MKQDLVINTDALVSHKVVARQFAPEKLTIGGKIFTIEQILLFDELVASLEETLSVATQSEEGEFADRARAILRKVRGGGARRTSSSASRH
ncbi:hypothetical protein ACUSIJ_24770 [Pseudochelatococcus sp. B33]